MPDCSYTSLLHKPVHGRFSVLWRDATAGSKDAVQRRQHLSEVTACLSISALRIRQLDSASRLRAGEGSLRAGGSNMHGTSPPSIQEEPGKGEAADEDPSTSELPPGTYTCPLGAQSFCRPNCLESIWHSQRQACFITIFAAYWPVLSPEELIILPT